MVFILKRSWVSLILIVCVLSGCASPLAPQSNPLTLYQQTLVPVAANDVLALKDAPRYAMTLDLDFDGRKVTGSQHVRYVNRSPDTLDQIYFRLYPNLIHYAGKMDVASITSAGQVLPFGYDANDTAVRVRLVKPLKTGDAAEVDIQWTLAAPLRRDGYTLFGMSQGILNLPMFYPMLSVYSADGWSLDQAPVFSDATYSEVSFYQITTTVASDVTMIANGELVTSTLTSDNKRLWNWVAGPAREFALIASRNFKRMDTQAYDTTVHTYYLAEDEDAAAKAANYAAASLRIYSDLFGRYPYRSLQIVESPLTFRGQEFPGLNLIGIDLFRKRQDELELRVAHEVAHQWWYGLVGNDQVRVSWLDEGLAEYSMGGLYYEAIYGSPASQQLATLRWGQPYHYAEVMNLDTVVAQPSNSFTVANYEVMIYAKAALFFQAMRAEVGNDDFIRILREYLRRKQYGIATPDDLVQVTHDLTGKDITPLMQKWIFTVSKQP